MYFLALPYSTAEKPRLHVSVANFSGILETHVYGSERAQLMVRTKTGFSIWPLLLPILAERHPCTGVEQGQLLSVFPFLSHS